MRLGNVEAAYTPYVAPAGDAAPPDGPAPGLIEVPVYGLNPGDAAGLVLTVDYDQIFLNFEQFRAVNDGWHRQQVSEDNTAARVLVTFTRYSSRVPVEEGEEFLIGYVQFSLNDVESSERPSSPRTLDVRLSSPEAAGSYYYTLGPDGNELPLDTHLTHGKITLFFQDAVALGSGIISPVEQDLSLPLFLTVLKPGDAPVVLTVDYDQIFLRFKGAIPIVPDYFRDGGIAENVEAVDGEEGATVSLTLTLNPEAIAGPLLRKHVADLRFTYSGEGPGDANVTVAVQLVSSDSPAEPRNKGGKDWRVSQIQVGSPYFVRGNVTSRYSVLRDGRTIYSNVGLVDAQLIFEYLMAAGHLPCRVAADVNADGDVHLTDGVMLLNYLFGSGALPSAPFPEPGWLEEHEAELGCEKSLPYFRSLEQP